MAHIDCLTMYYILYIHITIFKLCRNLSYCRRKLHIYCFPNRPYRLVMPSKGKHKEYFSSAMRLGSPSTCSPIGPVSYLGGVRDLMSLGQTNKEMSTCCRKPVVLKKLINRNWTRLLKSLGIDPPQFSTLLQSHQCIVSGSFALQSVTGEGLETCTSIPQNMHVYCTTSGYNEVLDYFMYDGYVVKEHPFSLKLFGEICNSTIAQTIGQCTVLSMHHVVRNHTVDLFRIMCTRTPRAAKPQFDLMFAMKLCVIRITIQAVNDLAAGGAPEPIIAQAQSAVPVRLF